MRIAITGAQGYLGSLLLRKILEGKEHQVTGFDIIPPREADHVFLDIGDPAQCEEKIKGFDILFHKVGLMGCNLSNQDPGRYYQINVSGTLNVLKACHAGGIRKIVFDSTESVFGPANHAPFDEESRPVPASMYSASKYIAEQYIASFCGQTGMKYAIMRYPRVVGHDSRMVVNTLIDKNLKREPVIISDRGKYRFDLIHADDFINANLAVLNSFNAQGIFHISGGETLSSHDLCDLIEKSTGIPLLRQEKKARDVSDGRFLANPMQLTGHRLNRETGYQIRYTSSQAVCDIASKAAARTRHTR